jgi:hypothetical protein
MSTCRSFANSATLVYRDLLTKFSHQRSILSLSHDRYMRHLCIYIKYQRLDTAQKTIKLHSPIIQTHGSEIYFQEMKRSNEKSSSRPTIASAIGRSNLRTAITRKRERIPYVNINLGIRRHPESRSVENHNLRVKDKQTTASLRAMP